MNCLNCIFFRMLKGWEYCYCSKGQFIDERGHPRLFSFQQKGERAREERAKAKGIERRYNLMNRPKIKSLKILETRATTCNLFEEADLIKDLCNVLDLEKFDVKRMTKALKKFKNKSDTEPHQVAQVPTDKDQQQQ